MTIGGMESRLRKLYHGEIILYVFVHIHQCSITHSNTDSAVTEAEFAFRGL